MRSVRVGDGASALGPSTQWLKTTDAAIPQTEASPIITMASERMAPSSRRQSPKCQRSKQFPTRKTSRRVVASGLRGQLKPAATQELFGLCALADSSRLDSAAHSAPFA
jgi:hypothetical protein